MLSAKLSHAKFSALLRCELRPALMRTLATPSQEVDGWVRFARRGHACSKDLKYAGDRG
jgi:hypothetical protein